MTALSTQAKRQTMYWAAYFAEEWRADSPQVWHSTLKPLLPSTRSPRDEDAEEAHRKTTRAIRQLRKASVREYEVLYRLLILGDSIEGVTSWLNERAIRNAIPTPEGQDVNYTEQDTWALFIAGVDFTRQCW